MPLARVFASLAFLIPAGIHEVVVGYLLVHLFGLLGVYLLDELGRNSSPYAAGFYHGVAQYQRTGCYDGSFAYHHVVEQGGTHADEGVVADGCAVDGDVVTHGYVVAYLDGGLLVQGVKHASVLYVHAIAHAYAVYIASDNGAEPDATIAPHYHITYDGCVVGEETVLAHLGSEASY